VPLCGHCETREPDNAGGVQFRVIVRRVALPVATVATLVAVSVSLFGGFAITWSGTTLFRSHDRTRPALIAVLAWAAYVAVGGAVQWPSRWNTARRRGVCHAIAAAIVAGTLIAGIAFLTTAVGGADTYGYASQADLWLQGRTTVDQPWARAVPWPNRHATFTPLGYVQSHDRNRPWTLVPAYPPGLPWLMAAGKAVGGQEGMFWATPVLAALLVLATYGIGSRLASREAGLVAAYLAATSPIVLFMQVQAMPDVPAAGAWALAIFFMLGASRADAVAAGLAAALAVTVRPNLVFCAGILGSWYAAKWWTATAGERPARLLDGVAYTVPTAAGIAAVALTNYVLNGSPLQTGYGSLQGYFSPEHLWPNGRDYFIRLLETQTAAVLLGLAALLVPLKRVWPAATDRAVFPVLGAFALAVWIFYCLYLHFDEWWSLRFLLPVWPLLLAGTGAVLVAVMRQLPALGRLVGIIAVIALGMDTVRLAAQTGAFDRWKAERHYVTVARLVRATTDARSVILSMQHSGSIRYYAGRITMRYDLLDSQWLDRAVAWLSARGIRAYLLIDTWEEPHVTRQFSGQRTLAQLRRPPAARYLGTTTVSLFDLSRALEAGGRPPDELVEDYKGSRSVEPVPLEIPDFD
jgi:predicted membrane-bound dolichyl-phosphate-mannose-protein mannosyltransferase